MADAVVMPISLIAGRYRLSLHIGSGEQGEVYKAIDEVTQRPVAVKRYRASEWADTAHAVREANSLRCLRIPGVVPLLDDGVDESGVPFLVMEYIEGDPFPGRHSDEPLATTPFVFRSLLQVLARVHAMGIVHGDIKPSNVLVDRQRRVTVVDFGHGVSPQLDRSFCRRPSQHASRYSAPEQLRGEPIGPSVDLYAVGLMMYEVLTGRLPRISNVGGRLEQEPLLVPAPVPHIVCRLIDQLLEVDPRQRTPSASAALAILDEDDSVTGHYELPWLGSRAGLHHLFDSASSGRSVRVTGCAGAGRSRLLADAEATLRGAGFRLVRLASSSEPFGSLKPLLPELAAQDCALSDLENWVLGRIQEELTSGTILVADDLHRFDRFSAAALAVSEEWGCILSSTPSADPSESCGAFHISPLNPQDLVPLFGGVDRLLHLREDAARELYRRTHGNLSRIIRETRGWIENGIARWDGRQLFVDRGSLERLSRDLVWVPQGVPPPDVLDPTQREILAWLPACPPEGDLCDVLVDCLGIPRWQIEAHVEESVVRGLIEREGLATLRVRCEIHLYEASAEERRRSIHTRLAGRSPAGSQRRLFHLIAAGRVEEIGPETLLAARRAADAGRTAESFQYLSEGLASARASSDSSLEEVILREWLAIALTNSSVDAMAVAQYELARVSEVTETIVILRQLISAAIAVFGPRPAAGLKEVDAIQAVPVDLLCWWHTLRIASAFCVDPRLHAACVMEAVDWSRTTGDSSMQARAENWLGGLRYQEDRFAEAAQHYHASARLQPSPLGRLAATLNAASSLMSAFRFEEAIALATTAEEVAIKYRLPHHEGRAQWIGRAARYGLGQALEPDLELVDAIEVVGSLNLVALVCLTEAAIAWRIHDQSVALKLASRAAEIWRRAGKTTDSAALAEALGLLCGAPASQEDHARLWDIAVANKTYGCGIQIAGLMAMVSGTCSPEVARVTHSLALQIPSNAWSRRALVLSVDEALAAIKAGSIGGLASKD